MELKSTPQYKYRVLSSQTFPPPLSWIHSLAILPSSDMETPFDSAQLKISELSCKWFRSLARWTMRDMIRNNDTLLRALNEKQPSSKSKPTQSNCSFRGCCHSQMAHSAVSLKKMDAPDCVVRKLGRVDVKAGERLLPHSVHMHFSGIPLTCIASQVATSSLLRWTI